MEIWGEMSLTPQGMYNSLQETNLPGIKFQAKRAMMQHEFMSPRSGLGSPWWQCGEKTVSWLGGWSRKRK